MDNNIKNHMSCANESKEFGKTTDWVKETKPFPHFVSGDIN